MWSTFLNIFLEVKEKENIYFSQTLFVKLTIMVLNFFFKKNELELVDGLRIMGRHNLIF